MGGNLKEALIRAALELIAQKGPAGFTFAEHARDSDLEFVRIDPTNA